MKSLVELEGERSALKKAEPEEGEATEAAAFRPPAAIGANADTSTAPFKSINDETAKEENHMLLLL